jgi:GntR family transcriptional regulator, transcriptional repressor for pyruvate dehydrogenase complex
MATPSDQAVPSARALSEGRLPGSSEIRPDPSKLSDRVAVDLGTRIVRGELLPGERLPTESELGDAFGVSRSVIRDAVRTLSAYGLVEVRQGVGMLVSTPGETSAYSGALIIQLMRSELSVGDVFEARATLETDLAAVAAVRSQESDWEAMEENLAAFNEAVKSCEWARAEMCHLAFHVSLLRATRLPALEILLKPLQEIIMLSSLPPSLEGKDLAEVWSIEDARRHRPILDAVRRRDEEGARTAMREHFPLIDNPRHAERQAARFRDSFFVQRLFAQILRSESPRRPVSSSGLLDDGEESA